MGIFSSSSNEKMLLKDFQQVEIILKEKEAIALSHQQLLELNSLKSKLISIISHDVRGPIANIKGMLNIYDLGLITDKEFRQNARLLSDSVDGTVLLLENLLSWSVLQIENQPMMKKSVKLHSIVSNVFTLLRPQSDKKSIKLINSVSPDYEIFVEPTMIELVIRNLVTNAIKFTSGGKIEVNMIWGETKVEIIVNDTGSGIPDEIAANLFNWNKKKSSPGTQLEKGTGIGLIICKDFVEKHGGFLSYSSRLNEGTSIHLILPISEEIGTTRLNNDELNELRGFSASG